MVILTVAGTYISESIQALGGMSGEAVLNSAQQHHHFGHSPQAGEDQDYHRLSDPVPPSNFYDHQSHFYDNPEQKYRPPPLRLNSGKIQLLQYFTIIICNLCIGY
jgi:hypothetical protein